ncbi:MAG: hypothetical protein KBA03_00800 [Anaerolineaceae bacterium]|nr:hypothetical protein [Anaerolineaceae bacterium]
MPAKKPAELVVRNETLDEKNQRKTAENKSKSSRELPESAPVELKDHPVAKKVWKRLIREFNTMEGRMITAQDRDAMVGLCLTVEEEAELRQMRKSAHEDWLARRQAVLDHKRYKDGFGEIDPVSLVELEKQALQLVNKVQAAYKTVLDIDSRLDRKRSSLKEYLSLFYLTPRSRAGVVPEAKDPEEDNSSLDDLLSQYVGGGK